MNSEGMQGRRNYRDRQLVISQCGALGRSDNFGIGDMRNKLFLAYKNVR